MNGRIVEYRVLDHGLTIEEHKALRAFIQAVHNDPRSWRSYGVYFKDVTDTKKFDKNQVRVYFYTNDEINDKFPSLDKLSVYSMGDHSIYFNKYRWVNGGVDPFPGDLNLKRYRTYVVNHEFGHSIRLDHPKTPPKSGKGSVMSQMSRGRAHIAPCVLNEWPLPRNIYDEFGQPKL